MGHLETCPKALTHEQEKGEEFKRNPQVSRTLKENNARTLHIGTLGGNSIEAMARLNVKKF